MPADIKQTAFLTDFTECYTMVLCSRYNYTMKQARPSVQRRNESILQSSKSAEGFAE